MTIYEQRADEAFAALIKDEPDFDEALKELIKEIFKIGWLAGLQYAHSGQEGLTNAAH